MEKKEYSYFDDGIKTKEKDNFETKVSKYEDLIYEFETKLKELNLTLCAESTSKEARIKYFLVDDENLVILEVACTPIQKTFELNDCFEDEFPAKEEEIAD
jgi:hypothetical protein